MFVASAADAATTEGLARPQSFEANPLMANRFVRIASRVALPAVAWIRMQRQGHRKAALFLRIGVAAGYSLLAVHNAPQFPQCTGVLTRFCLRSKKCLAYDAC